MPPALLLHHARALSMVLLGRALVSCAAIIPAVVRQNGGRAGELRACVDEAPASFTDGGALAGPFWDAFSEEVNAEAEELGLTVRYLAFDDKKLSVHADGAGVDELQELNRWASAFIDSSDDEVLEALPPFMLEVASPGVGNLIVTDRDYASFKGFPVLVTTSEPFKNKSEWEGTLVGRDDEFLSLNLKGRPVKIPIGIVVEVALPSAKRESGDTYGL